MIIVDPGSLTDIVIIALSLSLPRPLLSAPRSLVVRASARDAGGFDPPPRDTKDVKNGRFALLSLALGINELGNRLGGSKSV